MPAQIVHLALKVNNIDESLEFYKRIFGFSHTGTRRAGPLKDHLSCWLTDGTIGFTLIQYDSENAPDAKAVGAGSCIHHFGVAVPPDELADYIKTIQESGCKLISATSENPMKFRDPSGVILEVGTPDKFPR